MGEETKEPVPTIDQCQNCGWVSLSTDMNYVLSYRKNEEGEVIEGIVTLCHSCNELCSLSFYNKPEVDG